MTVMTDQHVLTIQDYRLVVRAGYCSCDKWEIGGGIDSEYVIRKEHAKHVQRVADFHALEDLLSQAGTTPDIDGETWVDAEASIERLRVSWGDV